MLPRRRGRTGRCGRGTIPVSAPRSVISPAVSTLTLTEEEAYVGPPPQSRGGAVHYRRLCGKSERGVPGIRRESFRRPGRKILHGALSEVADNGQEGARSGARSNRRGGARRVAGDRG